MLHCKYAPLPSLLQTNMVQRSPDARCMESGSRDCVSKYDSRGLFPRPRTVKYLDRLFYGSHITLPVTIEF